MIGIGCALLLFFQLGVAFSAMARDEQLGPQYLPADDPLVPAVRYLALRGEIPLEFLTMRPILRKDLARALRSWSGLSGSFSRDVLVRELEEDLEDIRLSETAPSQGDPSANSSLKLARFDREIDGGVFQLRPYVWAEGKWKDGRGISFGDHPRVGIRGTANYGPRFAIHQDIFVGRVENGRRFADAVVNHTDLLIFVESAYVAYQGEHWDARAGRTRQSMGPGDESSLLLSTQANPFDQVGYGVRMGSLRFRAETGVLRAATAKNIAVHRLEWTAHRRLVLGMTEGAVFQGSPLQPLYLLGFVPYSIVERLQGQDALAVGEVPAARNNLIWQFDAVWRMTAGSSIWAEILVDDVGTETSDLPTRLGYQFGGELLPSFGSGDVRLAISAAKVYDFTYSVYYDNSDWEHQGKGLGYHEGPDVERYTATLGWRPALSWSTEFRGHWVRKGEGRVGSPWYPSDDSRSEENPPGPEYELRGVVEAKRGGVWKLSWVPDRRIRVESKLLLDAVENQDHVDGRDRGEARWNLSVRWHY